MKRAAIVAAVVVGATGALAAPASAHKQTIPTTSTFSVQSTGPETSLFSGTVSSGDPKCVGGRDVTVGDVFNNLVAQTKSAADGTWSATGGPSGSFVFVDKKTLKKNKKHKHVCGAFDGS